MVLAGRRVAGDHSEEKWYNEQGGIDDELDWLAIIQGSSTCTFPAWSLTYESYVILAKSSDQAIGYHVQKSGG